MTTKTDNKTAGKLAEEQKTGGAVVAAQTNLPVASSGYGEDAGKGFEGTSGADMAIPFLGILQSNSPQVEDQSPAGAKAGEFFNSVTRELVSGETGVIVQPVYMEHAYVEWTPRTKGGGFVGMHSPDSEVVKAALTAAGGDKFTKLANGDNDLIETHYVYVLILDETGEETQGFALISFSSTKIKPYKNWLTAMRMLKGKPPLFANRAKLTTVKQKNEKGTFFNFQIDPIKGTWLGSLIPPGHALLTEAQGFIKMIKSGMARADFEKQSTREPGEGDAAPF